MMNKHCSGKEGRLIVASGPSGVGKGTICKELLVRNSNLALSISTTTRPPREGDVEGVNYYFKTVDEFKRHIDSGDFLEWAVYNENYYGTGKQAVAETLAKGYDVLLEIDVQGALKVKEAFPEAVLIFIVPPSKAALVERLVGRGTESLNEIERRVMEADRELALRDKYDYVVVNDILEDSIEVIENLIRRVV